jgi:hypothetical protein
VLVIHVAAQAHVVDGGADYSVGARLTVSCSEQVVVVLVVVALAWIAKTTLLLEKREELDKEF